MSMKKAIWKKTILAGFLLIVMTFCFRANAEAAWTENSDGTYSWYTDSGKLATSKWIQGKYYVNAKGIRVTGLQKISGKYYFFSKTTGELICGTWIKSDGKYYYAKSNGVLYTSCIKKINGSYYYFNAKGYRKTGKQTVDGNTYYFKKSNGKMVISKWVCISNKYYYFGTDGAMVTSAWVGRYYVNSNGVRVTSTWVGNKYVDSDGKCVSGLQLINGNYYYFDTTTYEKVTSQSVTVGEYTYSFDSSGVGTITSAYGREAATIAVEDSYYTDELVDDETLLAALIYCEAGNQSYTGMLAVGLVVLNRVNNENIPGTTIREVIYAENQFTPSANDNLTKALNGTLTVNANCKKAAAELMELNEGYKMGVTPTLTVNGVEIEFTYLFFMTPSAYRYMGLSASYITIGDHVFFKVWC